MVATITQGANTVAFTYDTAHMRILQEDGMGRTFYYTDPVSGIKIEKFIGAGGASQWNEYLIAGGEMVGEHFTKTPVGGTPITTETRYFVKDHLGSVAVLMDESGTVTERLSYDAWGKRRFPDGSDDPTGSITSETTRGFTGHEMIDAVGLVNMNGRIYDPKIGRFLSADPYIHEILDTQDLNRYSYVRNRSLSFTDASGYGFFSHIFKWLDPITYWTVQLKGYINQKFPIAAQIDSIVAFAACTYFTGGNVAAGAGCSAGVTAINTGISGGSLKDVFVASSITFVTSYVGGELGGAVTGNWAAQAVVGAATGAALGAGTAAITGGSIGKGAWLGAVSGAIGSIGGGDAELGSSKFFANVAIRATLGGAVSVLGGGKFANGAATAAFSYIATSAAQEWGARSPKSVRGAYDNAAPKRNLTSGEIALLEANGPNSGSLVKWDRVMIGDCLCDRSYTPNGGLILLNSTYARIPDISTSFAAARAELIHESVHVWQFYQWGPIKYYARAAKTSTYAYTLDSKSSYSSFNMEQQAAIFEDFYLMGQGVSGGSVLNSPSSSDYQAVISQVRNP